MCTTCGCGSTEGISILMPGEELNKTGSHDPDHEHHHHHHHHHGSHDHEHDHSHQDTRTLDLEKDILYKNNLIAERNRGFFEAKNILAINLVSSPGSGKTTLLEATIKALKRDNIPIYIIEGDQQTMNDSNRIASVGAPVVQVNTGKGCHLDSDMVHRSIEKLKPEENAVVFIENVGNLVCPSMFDLGESCRVVIMSVTEGEDKPLKYPTMFESSQVCLINKTDLLPYLKYNIDSAKEYVRQVNPTIKIFEISVLEEDTLSDWFTWLKSKIPKSQIAM